MTNGDNGNRRTATTQRPSREQLIALYRRALPMWLEICANDNGRKPQPEPEAETTEAQR